MEDYHYIPISGGKLRYLPAILTPAKNLKKGEGVLVYIPTLPADPEDLDQEPIVSEDV